LTRSYSCKNTLKISNINKYVTRQYRRVFGKALFLIF
jgi:hypothetical protein